MIQSVTSCCQREESIGSNRAETQAPNLVRVLSPSTRIERNVFSCSSTNEVAELNAKSAWAARSPVGSVWPARTCVVSSSGPCLIHDFYRRQPFVPFAWLVSHIFSVNEKGGVHRQTSARQPAGHRLGWFGKRDARFPLPGTHRSRRPASRRSAWPASAQRTVTLRAGAANPA